MPSVQAVSIPDPQQACPSRQTSHHPSRGWTSAWQKSTPSQLPNLIQHIENRFQKGLVTEVVIVDLSAACDTMNRRLFLKKILENTKDLALLNGDLLKDRRFYVVLNNKQSRWQQQLNGLPQCGALALL